MGRCPKNKISVLRDRVKLWNSWKKESEMGKRKRKSSKEYLRKLLITNTHASPKTKSSSKVQQNEIKTIDSH